VCKICSGILEIGFGVGLFEDSNNICVNFELDTPFWSGSMGGGKWMFFIQMFLNFGGILYEDIDEFFLDISFWNLVWEWGEWSLRIVEGGALFWGVPPLIAQGWSTPCPTGMSEACGAMASSPFNS